MNRLRIPLTVFLMVFAAACAVADDGIEFFPSVEHARQSTDLSKPVVMYFGATWCDPCRQMKSHTFELLKIDAAIHEFLWVGIDIDESPEVAAEFGVVAVPSIVILDNSDVIVGSHTGFVAAEDFVPLVRDALKNPRPPEMTLQRIQQMFDDESNSLHAKLATVIDELANPHRLDRRLILEWLSERDDRDKLAAVLVEFLQHEDLRIRGAAAATISTMGKRKIDFDPFASAEIRKTQVSEIANQLK